MKRLAAGALALAALVFAGVALSAGSYSDAVGDDNAAPDITSVTVAESDSATLAITIAVGNFQSLPEDSWLNVWFDTDSNASTGDEGDEALVRYLSSGGLQLYAWDGSQLVARPTTGVTGTFTGGALALTVPKISLGVGPTFGVLVAGARS
jgi:hypothetical protein